MIYNKVLSNIEKWRLILNARNEMIHGVSH